MNTRLSIRPSKRDLGTARDNQWVRRFGVQRRRDADDRHRIAGELEPIAREVGYAAGGKAAEPDPEGCGRHEQLAVLRQSEYERRRVKHTRDGAENTIEALCKNKSAVT